LAKEGLIDGYQFEAYNETLGGKMPTLYVSPAFGLLLGPLGVQELLVILLIALLIFGGRKIPEIFKGLGEGIREFKTSMKAEETKPTEEKKEATHTPST
jgi:sec-independent protein translocase protein TatA